MGHRKVEHIIPVDLHPVMHIPGNEDIPVAVPDSGRIPERGPPKLSGPRNPAPITQRKGRFVAFEEPPVFSRRSGVTSHPNFHWFWMLKSE